MSGAAADGDVRLVEERAVDNWVVGRPQIFLEGEWQQICAAGFSRPDADVVCGQLGHGAGTVLPFFDVPLADPDATDFAPIGVTTPGCDGTEPTLLECEYDYVGPPFFSRSRSNVGCRDERSNGLTIACVAMEQQGAPQQPCLLSTMLM